MRKLGLMTCLLCAAVVLAAAAVHAGKRPFVLRAVLLGASEVPAVLTDARGLFGAVVKPDGSVDFKLSYENLTGNPLAAHIHFAQPDVNGGVMVFLCGGGGKPACPSATAGTVTGTLVAADVLGVDKQGVPVGDLEAVLRTIEQGEGYVNIHTPLFTGGELRGQVRTH